MFGSARRLLRRYRKGSPESKKAFARLLVGGPGPYHFDARLGPDEELFRLLWTGYIEIQETVTALQDIGSLIRYAPRVSAGVPRSRLLRYHIGNYLNEVYILRERLKRHFKAVVRRYRGVMTPADRTRAEAVFKVICFSFDEIAHTRGSHVHDERYDDDYLDRMRVLEALRDSDLSDAVSEYYGEAVKATLAQWAKVFRTNSAAIDDALEAFFRVIRPIVFTDRGKWIVPRQERG